MCITQNINNNEQKMKETAKGKCNSQYEMEVFKNICNGSHNIHYNYIPCTEHDVSQSVVLSPHNYGAVYTAECYI